MLYLSSQGAKRNSVIQGIQLPSSQPIQATSRGGGLGGASQNLVTRVSNKNLITALLVLIILLINIKPAFGLPHYKPNHYKQYIYISLNYNIEQTYCLIELYHNESRFDPKARNGSHHGIPQGRSEYLKRVSGIKQIEWSKRYIGHRYGWIDKDAGIPNGGAAWDHFVKKGWH
jgi:hypothetical protein